MLINSLLGQLHLTHFRKISSQPPGHLSVNHPKFVLKEVQLCDKRPVFWGSCLTVKAGRAGETASAVVILESAVRQYEEILGIRHPGISTLSKKAEKLMENLESEEREQVR